MIKLLTQGTIEEKMDELQVKKMGLVEEIIEGSQSSQLTEEGLKELLGIHESMVLIIDSPACLPSNSQAP